MWVASSVVSRCLACWSVRPDRLISTFSAADSRAAAAVEAATPTSESTFGLDRPGSCSASWTTSAASAAIRSGTRAAASVARWTAAVRAASSDLGSLKVAISASKAVASSVTRASACPRSAVARSSTAAACSECSAYRGLPTVRLQTISTRPAATAAVMAAAPPPPGVGAAEASSLSQEPTGCPATSGSLVSFLPSVTVCRLSGLVGLSRPPWPPLPGGTARPLPTPGRQVTAMLSGGLAPSAPASP